MDEWPLPLVFYVLAQHLPRYRGDIAFSQEDKPEKKLHRVPFGPAEIRMRETAGDVSNVD